MRERPLKIRFCGDCGRMILVDFRFCPYCGSPVRPVSEGRASPAGGELTARPVAPPSDPAAQESLKGKAAIPRDGREARVLLDRLIRELEILDAEMIEWAAVNGKR